MDTQKALDLVVLVLPALLLPGFLLDSPPVSLPALLATRLLLSLGSEATTVLSPLVYSLELLAFLLVVLVVSREFLAALPPLLLLLKQLSSAVSSVARSLLDLTIRVLTPLEDTTLTEDITLDTLAALPSPSLLPAPTTTASTQLLHERVDSPVAALSPVVRLPVVVLSLVEDLVVTVASVVALADLPAEALMPQLALKAPRVPRRPALAMMHQLSVLALVISSDFKRNTGGIESIHGDLLW